MNADIPDIACRRCRDALMELTAGTLPATERQAVESHLASCPDCRRERDAWLALGDAVRERGEHVPPDRGLAAGLVRLRAALAFQGDDDFEDPEGEDPSMDRTPDRTPQFTDRRAPTTLYDDDRPAAPSGGSRGRPYLAVAATVAIALLSALIFGALATRLQAGPGPGATSSATPTPKLPATSSAQQTTVPALPGGVAVASISMLSASEGWAAAGRNGDATLLHYTGGRWTPSGATFADTYLTGISMDSHDDGWAVGARTDQVTGVVLHYSGGHWSQVQTPQIQFAGAAVWAFSPTRVLVLASLPKGHTGNLGSALLRYDNGAWTETLSPCGMSGASLLAADDLWATCLDGRILHYTGGHWTTYTIGGQAAGQGGQPLSISMLSDSSGWVGGFTNAAPQGIFLARFDGQGWSRVQGPAVSGPTDIFSITMLSATEGWASGDLLTATAGTQSVLLHYANGQWETVPTPYSGVIGKLTIVSATEGWAPIAGGAAAGLLHYQDGRWAPYNPGA